eukprot:gene17368-8965_t
MADKVDVASPVDAPPAEEKKLKACCACPETKKARDECYTKAMMVIPVEKVYASLTLGTQALGTQCLTGIKLQPISFHCAHLENLQGKQ